MIDIYVYIVFSYLICHRGEGEISRSARDPKGVKSVLKRIGGKVRINGLMYYSHKTLCMIHKQRMYLYDSKIVKSMRNPVRSSNLKTNLNYFLL